MLGNQADELIRYHREHSSHPILATARGQVICRSRYAEDRVAEATARGVRQYVLLGAGLDTFGCRSPLGALRVFEVDHPATQRWKRDALAAAQIAMSSPVTFVPADLGNGRLAAALRAGGFYFGSPAVVTWLGVTMYLSEPVIRETLAALSQCAPGTELIVDYMLPADLRDETAEDYVSQVAAAAAAGGEPWLTFMSPADMRELLPDYGFAVAAHVRQRDTVPASLWQRSDALRPVELSMITRAVRSTSPNRCSRDRDVPAATRTPAPPQ